MRLPTICVWAFLLAGAARAQPAANPADSPVAKPVVRGTVLIETSTGGRGTGWVADRGRRLIVTNMHVVLKYGELARPDLGRGPRLVGHDKVRLTFPDYTANGTLIAAKDYYAGATRAELVKAGRTTFAAVLDMDEARDLAVLVADRLPDDAPAIPLSPRGAQVGDDCFSIGHRGSADRAWLYSGGKVMARGPWDYRIDAPTAITRPRCQALRRTATTGPGDSGGPVVNAAGELVAVTVATGVGVTEEEKKEAYAIDVSDVRAHLAETDRVAAADTVEDLRRRGRHFLRRGRLTAAAADFRAAHARRAEAPAGAAETMLDLAAVTREQGRLAESLDWCETAAAEKSRPAGRAFAERAATRLRQLELDWPLPPEPAGPAWKALADLAEKDETYQAAVGARKKAAAESSQVAAKAILADVAAALAEDAKSALAYRTRAALLSRAATPDHPKIIDDRTAVVRLLNNAVARDAASLLDRAEAYRAAGQIDKAITDCEAALRAAPRSVVARARLCQCLAAAGRLADAVTAGHRLVQDTPAGRALENENPVHCEMYAGLFSAGGESALATTWHTYAIQQAAKIEGGPPHRRNYADRGDAYAAQKKHVLARADYVKAMKTPDLTGDQKPDSPWVALYQRLYSVPAIEKKLKALP